MWVTWVTTGLTKYGCIFFLFLLSLQSQAQRAYVFDYDGTIVEDRSDLRGNHETTYRLFRINYRGSAFQEKISGPAFVDISHSDWEKLTTPTYDRITRAPQDPGFLARGEGVLGSTIPYTLQNGSKIIPGHYMIVGPDTFFKYNEAPAGENYLEKAFAEAFKKTKRSEGRIQGEAFESFYKLVNNPETINSVFVVSARGHSFEEILEKLKNDRDKRKLIKKHVTDSDLESLARRHVMMMRQEYQQFDNNMGAPRVSVLKANYIAEIAKALINVGPQNFMDMLDSSGERRIRGVELVYFEDRYEYIEAVLEELRDLVQRRRILKVVIHNAGREADILLSEKPKTYVLTPFSRERALTPDEINEDLALRTLLSRQSQPSHAGSCSKYFGGA